MYSQYGIEYLLDALLPSMGIFLEIGAWDGTHFSHSKHLEEKGWSGLCVDPFPKNFEDRSCSFMKAAISKDGLTREFVKVTIDRRDGGDVSYLSGFKNSLGVHWKMIKEYCDYEIILIETMTMSALYDACSLPQHIDFLSVDVEGAELEVFNGIDFSFHTFGIIVFEHNGIMEVQHKIGEILHRYGYLRYLVPGLKWDDMYRRVLNESDT